MSRLKFHPPLLKLAALALTLIILNSCVLVVGTSNILFFFGVSTYSHRLLVWPFVETLANRGHNVTFLSPYLPSKSNPSENDTNQNISTKIHEFSPQPLRDFMAEAFGPESDLLSTRLANSHLDIWYKLPELGLKVCEILLSSDSFLHFINSSQFDLVIIDALFNDCGLGLAWKFQTQHVLFGTSTVFMWTPDTFGFPSETNYVPDVSLNYTMDMNFLKRVSNTLRPLFWHFYRNYLYYPKLERMFKEALNITNEDSSMPKFMDIQKNATLVLQNMHYSLDYPRVLPPLVVSVGGIHLARKSVMEELPKNMKDFLDSSEGFIYVSFGSAVQVSKMPKEMQQEFIYTFGNYSSLRFLWKYENHIEIQKLPKNIFTSKWVPQQTVLKHQKIKGFITHGGILSIEESISNQVPMILMPVFADQDYNAENVIRRGCGLKIHFKDVGQSILKSGIDELLTNKMYKERTVEISKLFEDRPIPPMDEAVWWVEHILRNPNSDQFRRPFSEQNWYQRRLLDVWLFVGLTLFLLLLFFALLLKFMTSSTNSFYKMHIKFNTVDTKTQRSKKSL